MTNRSFFIIITLVLFSVSLCKSNDMENWIRVTQTTENGYFVSDLGRMKIIKNSSETIKIGSLRNDGYRIFIFNARYIMAHYLVLESFVPRPDWATCINHINGIKDDNRLVNLEWSTVKLNNLHAIKNGLNKHIGTIGVDHPHSRDIKEIHAIYNLKKQGKKIFEITKILGLPNYRVVRVYNGIDWRYEYEKVFGAPCEKPTIRYGSDCYNSIPEKTVLKIYELKKSGKRISKIVEEVNIKYATVHFIFHGRSWKKLYKLHFP